MRELLPPWSLLFLVALVGLIAVYSPGMTLILARWVIASPPRFPTQSPSLRAYLYDPLQSNQAIPIAHAVLCGRHSYLRGGSGLQ
jgi:hypothetical protein